MRGYSWKGWWRERKMSKWKKSRCKSKRNYGTEENRGAMIKEKKKKRKYTYKCDLTHVLPDS
jgi:hypothetical protein